MLAKQCWRLITKPDSLVARLYKAIYYADTNFLQAKLGGSPSFIWRSIMEARNVISAGSVWRIGNGKDIQILNQPWLNDLENPYVITHSPAIVNQKVNALFQPNTTNWDLEVITDIFEERDQRCIVNTVVEQGLNADVLSWKLEISGEYSVRSAYRMLQKQKGDWERSDTVEFWKNLWNIKAPPKVLNLIWRAINHCLPTKVQLQTKYVPVDNSCPVCNEAEESLFHALVNCRSASRVWQLYNQNINTESCIDFSMWLKDRLTGQSKENMAKILTICWSIWRARNDLVWSNRRWKELKIVAKAMEYFSQWKVAQSREFRPPVQPSFPGDGAILWVKPHHNEVKISADAAIFEEQGKSGIGLVARNHEGQLLTARVRSYSEVMNPGLAEAIAIKEALSWAKEQQLSSVSIESDCLAIVQLVRSAVPMRSRIGRIVEDCRDLIRGFNNLKLYFVKRSANMSAHELARVSHMYPDRSFDWSSVPINVRNCLLEDLK